MSNNNAGLPEFPQSRTEQYLDVIARGGGGGGALPAVTSDDNGDVLTVVNGEWDKAAPSGGGDSGHTFESVTAKVLDGLVDPENDEYGSSNFYNDGFGPFAFPHEPTINDAWEYEVKGNTYHATSVQSQTDYSEYECGSFEFYDSILDYTALSGSYGNFTAAILEDLYGEVPAWFKGDGYYFYNMYPTFDTDEEYHYIPTEMTFTVAESSIEFEDGFLKMLREDLDIAPIFNIQYDSGSDAWYISDKNGDPADIADIPKRMVVFRVWGEVDSRAYSDMYYDFSTSNPVFDVMMVEQDVSASDPTVIVSSYHIMFGSNGVSGYRTQAAKLTGTNS